MNFGKEIIKKLDQYYQVTNEEIKEALDIFFDIEIKKIKFERNN